MIHLTTISHRKLSWLAIVLIFLMTGYVVHSYRTKIEVVGDAKQHDIEFVIGEIQRIGGGRVISGLHNFWYICSPDRINFIKLNRHAILYGPHGEEPTLTQAIVIHVWRNGSSDVKMFLCRWNDAEHPVVTPISY
jgi:hypothetical protein